jgi:hypothetical protein
MVVARFTDDGQLYMAKVISITNKLASVLFIDFGESELQPVDSFMELPAQLRDLEPLAERVKLEGVEEMTDNKECREMVDKQLDKEGISMMMNDKGEASFWLNGEKIMFGYCELSSGGWKIGDKVVCQLCVEEGGHHDGGEEQGQGEGQGGGWDGDVGGHQACQVFGDASRSTEQAGGRHGQVCS